MAGKRKAPAKKQEPTLEFVDGYWYILDGTEKGRLNVGRNQRYAERMLAERTAK